jgi:hypothetical protein
MFDHVTGIVKHIQEKPPSFYFLNFVKPRYQRIRPLLLVYELATTAEFVIILMQWEELFKTTQLGRKFQ